MSANSTIEDFALVIEREANRIKDYGHFNFLLSNLEYIFAFGDDSLYYTKREYASKGALTLEDTDYTINVSDMKSPGEKAIIVATKQLTREEKWRQITGLRVFRDGIEKSIAAYSNEEVQVLRCVWESPHKVSVSQVSAGTGLSLAIAEAVMRELFDKKLIRRSPRNSSFSTGAEYCTEESKRDYITALLRNY